MGERTKPAVASSGRKQDGRPLDGGAVSYPQNITLRARRQDVARFDGRRGRAVGCIVGDVLRKELHSSRHLLHTPPAWAVDAAILDQCERVGVTTVQVVDLDTGDRYVALLSSFRRFGRRFNRGCGDQVYLTLDHWTVEREGWTQPGLWSEEVARAH